MALLPGVIPRSSTGTAAWLLGSRTKVAVPGHVVAIRYWRLAGDPGPHVGQVWAFGGKTPLAEVTFSSETESGPQEQALPASVAVVAGTTIITSVTSPAGSHYAVQPNVFAGQVVDGPLTYPGAAGSYGPIGAYPSQSTTTYYFREPVFVADAVPTVVVTPDSAMSGGFIADLAGFAAGGYTLGISIKNSSGTIVGEIPIVLPSKTA